MKDWTEADVDSTSIPKRNRWVYARSVDSVKDDLADGSLKINALADKLKKDDVRNRLRIIRLAVSDSVDLS